MKVSAPGKLMLFGEHAVVYGHPCIVTAVNSRLTVSVEKSNTVEFHTPGTNNHEFLQEAVRYATERWNISSVTIDVSSSFTGKYGFGSSAAVTVATMKAITDLFSIPLSRHELFQHCYQIVLNVQKIGSGFDLAASLFGGTIYYEQFGKIIEPVEHPGYELVIGYTGEKANTVSIVEEIAQKKEQYPEKVERIFSAITDLVHNARKKIEEGDVERVGKLMDYNQEYLRDLGVSSEKLEALIQAAKKTGALGAKLSGAGRGDCMIALVSKEKRRQVEQAIVNAGGEVLSVSPDAEGVL